MSSYRYDKHSRDKRPPRLSQPQPSGRLTAPRPPHPAPSPACLPAAVAMATAPSWRAPGRAQPRRALARMCSEGGGRRGAQRCGGGAGGRWQREWLRRKDGRVPGGRGGNGARDRTRLPAWRLLSGPAEGLGWCPSASDPTPRRPPPPSLSPSRRVEPRVPGTGGRQAQPLFCLSGSQPLAQVFTVLLDSGFYSCRCRSLGEKA